MSLTNGSFETAGTNEYDADGWTVTVVGTNATAFAVFDTGTSGFAERGSETFAGWGTFYTGFTGFFVDLTYAFFDLALDPKNVEDYEDLWGAGPAMTVPADDGSDDGPYALADGQTLTIAVNGGAAQTITFSDTSFLDITDARPEEVAIAINAQLVGASAKLDGAAVRLVTDAVGLATSIQVTGGTALGNLGFDTATYQGTDVGGPFIHTLEFSLAHFGTALDELDSFESEWPSGTADDLLGDLNDTRNVFDTQAPDTFESGYGTYDYSLGGGVSWSYPTFTGTGNDESFEGTWTTMSTI